MIKKRYFIIDFDSTFVTIESLDKLAEIALRRHPKREKILQKITEITNQGMNGSLPFTQSLQMRLQLFTANRQHIESLIRVLKKNITPSISRNKEFFNKYKQQIYIISGGFKDYIYPLFKPYGIEPDHILANEFRFDPKNMIVGFDEKNVLSKSGGKVKQIISLQLTGEIYVIGDGFTDFQIKQSGHAHKFFVFCENIKRETVVGKADYILPNFDEFLYLFDLPRAYSYPKNRIKVLLLESINEVAVTAFKKEGYQVDTLATALSEKELAQKISEISILGIRSKTEITEAVLRNARRLLSVGAFCIGTNQIDLSACAQKGIAVFNAPYSNTRSVVELVIGEMIMLMRKTFDKSMQLHQGLWDKSVKGCFELRGKKLGIVGYGNIGSQVSVLAEMLGMETYYFDVSEKLALGNAKRCQSLTELLRLVDVVSVHVDGRTSNTQLIGKSEFAQMKTGALFLNLSRGHVVDLQSLVAALKTRKLAGAAVDVYPEEPETNKVQFQNDLQGIPNVILTPHIGGNTYEAQTRIGEFVSHQLIRYINTGNTMLSVNFPGVQLPKLEHAHRLLHVHNNVPGVLASINSVFASHHVNIVGQHLSTNQNIGMAITDINKTYDEKMIHALRQIKETIRLRVLY